jgi:hypothetical protein
VELFPDSLILNPPPSPPSPPRLYILQSRTKEIIPEHLLYCPEEATEAMEELLCDTMQLSHALFFKTTSAWDLLQGQMMMQSLVSFPKGKSFASLCSQSVGIFILTFVFGEQVLDKKEETSVKALLLSFKKEEAAVKMQIQSFRLHCENVLAYDVAVQQVKAKAHDVLARRDEWVASAKR